MKPSFPKITRSEADAARKGDDLLERGSRSLVAGSGDVYGSGSIASGGEHKKKPVIGRRKRLVGTEEGGSRTELVDIGERISRLVSVESLEGGLSGTRASALSVPEV